MSRATITLPNELLDELMRVAPAKSKTEAVLRAVREEIRLRKIEKIRAAAGKLEFAVTADELRHGDRRLG